MTIGGQEVDDGVTVAAGPHSGTASIGEMLTEPSLHVEIVVPTADLARPIRFVYPTELADPSPYLMGEELILSVGVPVLGQPETAIDRYVSILAERRVTGLVIGIGDVFDDLPAPLVQSCTKRRLPLLIQRPGVPFRRIIDWVDSRRAADRDVEAGERDLGSMLRWFMAGTLGVGPVEAALARHGLSGSPVAVCAFPAELHTRVHALVDRHRAAVALLGERIVALCPHTPEFQAELAASELVCGVALGADPQSMARAIPEALEALQEAARRRRVVHIDEIATVEGLLAAVPKVRLVPFVQRLLVPLVEHDKTANAFLVSSLEAFLAPGNDISAAASQLYVHVNTLRNRLAKIAELTGANPLDEGDRINFRIALWAARNMGMGERAQPAGARHAPNVVQDKGFTGPMRPPRSPHRDG